MKNLDRWMPCELTANQKRIVILKCHHPLFCATAMNHFSIGLWHAMKSGFFITTGEDQLSGWTKKKLQKTPPKPDLYQIKVMVTVWWSAVHLLLYSFLNPGEIITSEKYTQQIDEMYRKLQLLQPALVNRKGSILLHDSVQPYVAQPTLQKLNKLDYEVLKFGKSCSSAIFTWPLSNLTTTSSSISITFCRQTAPTTSKRQKMLSKSSSNPEAWIFRYGNKQTYFSLAKM